MESLKKAVSFYDKLEEFLLAAGITVSVLLLFANVILRYLFNSSIYGVDEITRIIFIWISWLGISIGERKGEHITIDLVLNKFKGTSYKVVRTISNLCTLTILGALAYFGCIVTFKYFNMGATSPMWHIPNWFIYLSVPVGCGIMGLRVLAKFVDTFKKFPEEGSDEI